MARCSCGNAACSCVIKSKPNGGIVVTGSGSPERPYEISTVAGGNPLDSLTVSDSATLDLTMAGAGTPEDKRRISGTVIAKIRDLTDVSKTDTPVVGDVIQWNGIEWVFAAPGATAVPVSGVWGTAPLDIYGADSLVGQPIYADSNGQIRTRPHVLDATKFPSTALVGTYPRGPSVMVLSSTDTAGGSGWPQTSVTAIVETYRTPFHAVQRFSRVTSTGVQTQWQRSGDTAAWGPWTWVGGQAPHYSATKGTSQALTAANTSYTITYDTVVTNEGSPAITYAAGVFTVPIAGKYAVNINQHVQRSATTTFTSYLYAGGVLVQSLSHAAAPGNFNIALAKTLRLAAGATIYYQLRANVTGGVAFGDSTRYSTIDITLVGG